MDIEDALIEETKSYPLTTMLIAVNVIVFILVFSLPQQAMEAVFSAYSFSAPHALEIWRWFTSLFLHASASHLFFNMLGLYFFGKTLEEKIEAEWFLSIYFVSGLLGSFAFMLTSSGSVVGASGCVFGIMGAAMLMNPIKRIHLYVFPLPLGIVAISFVIVETLMVYFRPLGAFAVADNVAHIAHVAGVLTGSVFAFFRDPKRSMKGVLALAVCVVLLVALAPLFALVALFGGFVLNVIDKIIGFALYGIARLISPIWG